ncbi:hypothetical protein FRC03_009889 [Tulasnella sp. 419]|nr:hypothetical protein FRC03_009889 [Tulasnella sp. 419]
MTAEQLLTPSVEVSPPINTTCASEKLPEQPDGISAQSQGVAPAGMVEETDSQGSAIQVVEQSSSSLTGPLVQSSTSNRDQDEGITVGKLKVELAKWQEEVVRLKEDLDKERQERKRRDEEVSTLRQFKIAHDTSHSSEALALIKNINYAALTLADDLSANWDRSKEKLIPRKGAERPRGLDRALAQCPLDHIHALPLLQAGFRVCIMRCVSTIMSQPCYGMDESFGPAVHQLVDTMARTNVSQATFARWRALAYDAILSDISAFHRQMIPSHRRRVIYDLEHSGMLLTGRRLEKNEYEKLERDTELEERLGEIISMALQFMRMVHVNIISANLKHTYHIFGKLFNGKEMTIPQALEVPVDGDKVVATVALGLLRQERVIREGIGAPEDDCTILLEAEVLTEREITAFIKDMPITSQTTFMNGTSQNWVNKVHTAVRGLPSMSARSFGL